MPGRKHGVARWRGVKGGGKDGSRPGPEPGGKGGGKVEGSQPGSKGGGPEPVRREVARWESQPGWQGCWKARCQWR